MKKHVLDIDINHGVFIDIFPLDGYVKKGIARLWTYVLKKIRFWKEADKNALYLML